jgi:hypothetical protein
MANTMAHKNPIIYVVIFSLSIFVKMVGDTELIYPGTMTQGLTPWTHLKKDHIMALFLNHVIINKTYECIIGILPFWRIVLQN